MSRKSGIEDMIITLEDLQRKEASAQRQLISHEALRNKTCKGKDGTEQRCCSLSQSPLVCTFNQQGGQEKTDRLLLEIRTIASERSLLIKTLQGLLSTEEYYQEQVRQEMINQLTAAILVDADLERARSILEKSLDKFTFERRMVEINTYDSKLYGAYTEVAKLVVITLCMYVIVSFGEGLVAPVLPEELRTAGSYLSRLVLLVGGFYVLRKCLDIWGRSNMDFDQYDWSLYPTGSYETVYQYDKKHLGLPGMGGLEKFAESVTGICYGQECCADGTVYDTEAAKCTVKRRDYANEYENDRNMALQNANALSM